MGTAGQSHSRYNTICLDVGFDGGFFDMC